MASGKRLRVLLLIVPAAMALAVIAILASDAWIGMTTDPLVFGDPADCPSVPVALVLGASPMTDGYPNLFYRHRIRAAAELFSSGRVRALLVSGDNSRKGYDEPTEMKADLVRLGVPGEYVTCDYAGFRTLDSIIRAREVFGQPRFIVVSQRFHCQRAIFLARRHGCEAFGLASRDVEGYRGARIRVRESLARFKAVLDLLGRKEPRFLGKPESVPLREEPRS